MFKGTYKVSVQFGSRACEHLQENMSMKQDVGSVHAWGGDRMRLLCFHMTWERCDEMLFPY